nr:L(+)-tartrate dehydratase subunit beta [Fundidesulfovibrio soli]
MGPPAGHHPHRPGPVLRNPLAQGGRAVKKILNTPISSEDIASLRVGDVVFLNGHIVTCRDVGHRRLIELGRELPVDLKGLAIFHAGPIVVKDGDGWKMISIGPTTSMRMERFEDEFIERTGVKLIVGKGGMGPKTAEACKKHKALHAVFPGGCAVLAATEVEEIERVEWEDLGMPEALWVCRVKEFGPLIISIDTEGNNLFEENKARYNESKGPIIEEINRQVRFIK